MSEYLLFISMLLIINCTSNNQVVTPNDISLLTEVASYPIDVPEPSGLSLNLGSNSLWTVSDQTGMVYKIGFSGQLLKVLSFKGEDLEGVCQSPIDGTLWVVEERKREMVQLDSSGQELKRYFLPVERNADNNGLEGIAVHPVSGLNYVLNEKNPVLFLKLAADQSIAQKKEIDYLADCSGLAFEEQSGLCWLVSDESKLVVKCEANGSKLAEYKIPVDKAEGIAVSTADSLIYIVSDSKQKLYLFRME